MTLEATVIILDNSDYARNGDSIPTRWDAINDAFQTLSSAKLQANPESVVGLMTMANQPEVIIPSSKELSQLQYGLTQAKLGGKISFTKAIKISQLVLRHRVNKNQRQKIVVFVASPITETPKQLQTLAKILKKNNISIDIINVNENINSEKFQNFMSTINDDSCKFVNIEQGNLETQLVSSSIMAGVGGQAGGAMDELGLGGLDDELQQAIRLSLEEAKQAEEKQRQLLEQQEQGSGPEQQQQQQQQQQQNQEKMDEEIKLEESKVDQQNEKIVEENEIDEEEEERRAIALSLQEQLMETQETKTTDYNTQAFQDQTFVNSLLDMLPGVDKNSEQVQEALAKFQQNDQNKEQDKDKDKK